MKVKKFDQDSEGAVQLVVNVSAREDIWHLYNLISVGDIVRCTAVRKVKSENATGASSSEKRKMTLSLQVTQPLEYDANGIIRVSGQNRTECEWVRLGAHHTSTIMWDPPQDVGITKPEWDVLSEARLKEACDEDGRADTAAVLMQNGLCNLCLLNGSLCTVKQRIETTIKRKTRGSGAARDDSIIKFFQLVLDAMVTHINLEKVRVILICSPGNVREEFVNFIAQEGVKNEVKPEVKNLFLNRQKFVLCHVSSGHKHALSEALADASVQSKMSDTRAMEDVKAWKDFQDMMNNDPDRCTYGVQAVFVAQEDHHAVDHLLISDELFRSSEPLERHFYAALVEEVKEFGGKVTILSTQHVPGERLRELTGIAAILRMPLEGFEDDIEIDPKFTTSSTVQTFVRDRLEGAKEAATATARTKSYSTGDDDAQ